MPSPWIEHLANFRKKNPGMSLKIAMQKAKLSYKKQSGGNLLEIPKKPIGIVPELKTPKRKHPQLV